MNHRSKWALGGPRRPADEGEILSACVTCGRIEPPLNDTELWHYACSGEGLVTNCPRYQSGQWRKCAWAPLGVDDKLGTAAAFGEAVQARGEKVT